MKFGLSAGGIVRRTFGILLFGLALIGTACSGDDAVLARSGDGGERADFVAGIADGILTADTAQTRPLGLTAADAVCISEALVDEFGVQRLLELGVTNDTASSFSGDELVDADREQFADTYLGCVSLHETVAQSMVDVGVSDESAACFSTEITENPQFVESFRTMLIDGTDIDAALTSDPALLGELLSATRRCLSPAELESLISG